MFTVCENMKWNHLPNAGGIFDQHPQLIEHFRLIFSMRAQYEEKERRDEERKRKQKAGSQARSRTRRR